MTESIESYKRSNIEKLSNSIDTIENKNIKISVKSNQFKPKNQYVIMFPRNMLETIEKNRLTITDLKVLIAYCELCQYGNQISISQQDVAEMLSTDKSNVNKSVQKFKKCGIFYTKDGKKSLYINPIYLAKGSLDQFRNQINDDVTTKKEKFEPKVPF